MAAHEELPNVTPERALGPFERTFETQVLISLAEIKGTITLIAEREKSTRSEVEGVKTAQAERARHVDRELSRLSSAVSKGMGIAIAIATLMPVLVIFIGQQIGIGK